MPTHVDTIRGDVAEFIEEYPIPTASDVLALEIGLTNTDSGVLERLGSAKNSFPVLSGICSGLVQCVRFSRKAEIASAKRIVLQRRLSMFLRILDVFANKRPNDIDEKLVEHLDYLFEYLKERIIPMYQELDGDRGGTNDTVAKKVRKWLTRGKSYDAEFVEHEAFLTQWVQDFTGASAIQTLMSDPTANAKEIKGVAAELKAELEEVKALREEWVTKNTTEEMHYSVKDDDEKRFNGDESASPSKTLLLGDLRRLFKRKYKSYGSVTGGVRDGGGGELESDKIYTTLTLLSVNHGDDGVVRDDSSPKPSKDKTASKVQKIDALDIYKAANKTGSRLLLVEGRAGIGKSTFAQQIARVQPSQDCYFVTVHLGTLAAKLTAMTSQRTRLPKLQLIAMALCSSDRDEAHFFPSDDICFAAAGVWGSQLPITWVLDGLDEVAQNEDRRIVSLLQDMLSSEAEGSSLKRLRPNDVVVVTSREECGLQYFSSLSRATRLRIDVWKDEEIHDYIERYFSCRTDAPPEAEGAAKALLLPSKRGGGAPQTPSLGSFARLPITCELLCYLYCRKGSSGGDIGSISTLYQKTLFIIYTSPKNRKNRCPNPVDPDVDFADVERLAKRFAIQVATAKDGNLVFGTDVSAKSPEDEKLTCKALVHSGFVRQVTGEESIFDRRYQFLHKSFMEYFAATALCEDLAMMKEFAFDVDESQQQRNLMVLVASTLVSDERKYAKQRAAFEDKIVANFQKHYRANECDARGTGLDAKSRIARREAFRRQCGMASIAEILRIFHEPWLVDPSGAANRAAAGPAPIDASKPLPKIKSPFFDRLDGCVSRTRTAVRHAPFRTEVPLLYGCIVLPLAEQDAVHALAYVQRRIVKGKQSQSILWRAEGEYDRALLSAVLAGSRRTEELLLSRHFSAEVNLFLAAELGATSVLKKLLVSRKAWENAGTLALFVTAYKNPTTLRALAELWRAHIGDPAVLLSLCRDLIMREEDLEIDCTGLFETIVSMATPEWKSIRFWELQNELLLFRRLSEPGGDREPTDTSNLIRKASNAVLRTLDLPATPSTVTVLKTTLLSNEQLLSSAIHFDFHLVPVTTLEIRSVAARCPNLLSLSISNTGSCVSAAAVIDIAHRCAQLQHIDLSHTNDCVTDDSLMAIAEQCHHLRSLNISNAGAKLKAGNDAAMKQIASRCSQLQWLNVSHTGGNVTDAEIKAIAEGCKDLRHLDVSHTCSKVTDVGVNAVANSCAQLQTLNVSQTGGEVTDSAVKSIAEQCQLLRHLDVSNTGKKVTDAGIIAIAQGCSQLESLDVSHTDGKVTDKGIKAIASRCHDLLSLNVSCSDGEVTDASIIAVAEQCKQLRSLNVRETGGEVTNSAIEAIADGCQQLEHLAVGNMDYMVTDDAIKAVASRCPQLLSLDVSCTGGKVTDEAIVAIADGCSRITSLNVQFTGNKVTSTGIKAIADGCRQLRHLDVSHTGGKVTSEAVSIIADRCPQISSLNLSHSGDAISDQAIATVANSCPLLQQLDVSHTGGKVSDTGIKAIARLCPQLLSLDVSGTNGKVTDAAIIDVACNCHQLQSINVSHTGGEVTSVGVAAFAQGCPQLQSLDISNTDGKVTDEAILAVANSCRGLVLLDVSNTSGKITDSAIVAVATSCSHLQDLDVSHTRGKVTDVSILAVATLCRQLQSLNVSHTGGQVTNVAFVGGKSDSPPFLTIKRSFPQLRGAFERLFAPTPEGQSNHDPPEPYVLYVGIAEHCPRMQHLDVSHTNGAVTDTAIIAVANRCRQLKSLKLRAMDGKLADAAVKTIADCSQQLRLLDIRGSRVKDASIMEVQRLRHSPFVVE